MDFAGAETCRNGRGVQKFLNSLDVSDVGVVREYS
jgi:hypothetical protein